MKEKPVGIEPEKDTKSGVSKLVEEAAANIHKGELLVPEERKEYNTKILTNLATAIYTELEAELKAKAYTPWDYYHDCEGTQQVIKIEDLALIAEKKKLLK